MRPEAVLEEIIGPQAGKSKRWVLERIPRSCRWNQAIRTNPPLFSERRTREWWEKGKAA